MASKQGLVRSKKIDDTSRREAGVSVLNNECPGVKTCELEVSEVG